MVAAANDEPASARRGGGGRVAAGSQAASGWLGRAQHAPTYFFSNSPVRWRFTNVVFPTPPSPTSTSLNCTSGPAAAAPAAAAWAAAASCATTRPTSAQTRSTRAARPAAHSSAAPAQLHIFQNIAAAVQNSDAIGGRGEAVAERRWTSAAVQEQRRVEAHHAAASPETQPLMRGSARCRRSLPAIGSRWPGRMRNHKIS